MSEPRLRRLWPLGPLPLIVPGVLICGIVVSSTAPMWHWPYQEWPRTSSEFIWQLAIAGPLAAASAAYFAGRTTPPTRLFALRSACRPPRDVLIRHLGLLTISHLLGFIIALLPLIVITARSAEAGQPDLIVMATGIVGLIAATLVGYLIGLWGRSAIVAPLAFVVLLGVTVIGTSGMNALSPVPERVLVLGEQASWPLLVYRLVLLVLVVIACLQLSSALLHSVSRVPSLSALGAVPVILLLVVVASKKPPTVSTFDPAAPRVCVSRSATEYCVHAGHRRQLAAFVAGDQMVIKAYGFAPARARHVYDRALLGEARPRQAVIWPSLAPDTPADSGVADAVAGTLSGQEACSARYGFDLPSGVADFTSYFYEWLRGGGQVSGSFDYNPFKSVSRRRVQQWISRHDKQIRSCSVDLRTLPR